jgi:hypothetical protein
MDAFASDDGGANWQPVNDSWAHTIVATLYLSNSNTLVAFTHGRCTFATAFEPCPSCFARDGDLTRDGDVDFARLCLLRMRVHGLAVVA